MKKLLLNGNSLTIEDFYKASNSAVIISIAPSTYKKINSSRKLIEEWLAKNEKVYGVTTGVGIFSNVVIPAKKVLQLQKNLIISHTIGSGELLPDEIVRGMMILRLNTLVKGNSGVRLELLKQLTSFINSGILPIIPSKGSVGSSGDLIPLAHMVLPIMGIGKCKLNGKIISAKSALKQKKLKPIKLFAKEGLALINGTQMMTSFGGNILKEANDLLSMADLACAMSVEALKGSDTPFMPEIHELRPHTGQKTSAKNILGFLEKSEIRESHRTNDDRVQDAYSLRCAPQVHGASRDAINYAISVIQTEMNSVNDNPLIFPEIKKFMSAGNFHGQPIALALDFTTIALSEIANISERRIDRIISGSWKELPKFLVKEGGLNSGMMMTQYLAASLVSENKVLSHPASVDSIPTSANQEDHNSMGSISAQKCYKVLQNVQTVLAIEYLVATAAIDFYRPMKCGKATEKVYKFLRKYIKPLTKDRLFGEDLELLLQFVKKGKLLDVITN